MHETATALTDLLLAIESAALAVIAGRTRTTQVPLRGSTVLLFWALSLAALLGFITHGFVENHSTMLFALLWRTLLLSIAVTGSATWAAAGFLWPSYRVQRVFVQIAGVSLGLFAVLILVNVQRWAEGYGIAIASYAPAMTFLLVSFIAAFVRQRARSAALGALGVLLSFAAAAVQQSSLAVGPVDHNALYHIVQAIGLILLLIGLRGAGVRDGMMNSSLTSPTPRR